MRIVRREVSRVRILGHAFILTIIGGYLAEYYINGDPILEMFAVFMIAQYLSGMWLTLGKKSTMMRCLERGPDFTVNGSRMTVHRSGTYKITQTFSTLPKE